MLVILLGSSLPLPTIPCAQEAQASKLSLHFIQHLSCAQMCPSAQYLCAIMVCIGAQTLQMLYWHTLLNIQMPGPAPFLQKLYFPNVSLAELCRRGQSSLLKVFLKNYNFSSLFPRCLTLSIVKLTQSLPSAYTHSPGISFQFLSGVDAWCKMCSEGGLPSEMQDLELAIHHHQSLYEQVTQAYTEVRA